MKSIILAIALIAFVSAQSYNFTVSQGCNPKYCQRNFWTFNNTQASMDCPVVGEGKAYLYNPTMSPSEMTLQIATLNKLGKPEKVFVPLKVNFVNIEAQFDHNTTFSIQNCQEAWASQNIPLCKNHTFVGIRKQNNTVLGNCTFGLDAVSPF
ncbi:hypothetical protein ABPG74_002785 [Tetrahymena malaccensis]